MKFRKPFELKKLIICHNIIQVASCIFVVHEVCALDTKITWKGIDFSIKDYDVLLAILNMINIIFLNPLDSPHYKQYYRVLLEMQHRGNDRGALAKTFPIGVLPFLAKDVRTH